MTTRERRERRAARRREWAESRERKRAGAIQAFEAAREQVPPMGEPIKVGHHSERRHRAAFDRVDRALQKVGEHDRMAQRHHGRAANLERELDRAIYDDDPDAIERLEERIAGLEAQRDRMKAINRAVRATLKANAGKLATGWDADLGGLTEREQTDLKNAAQFDPGPFRGYPSYALSNLGGQISKTRQRVARLKAQPERIRCDDCTTTTTTTVTCPNCGRVLCAGGDEPCWYEDQCAACGYNAREGMIA